MGKFGDKFRKARESKKLSLDEVSNVTKISSRMLKAIEEENFDLLPGGVFNKGFIRAYAKHVGLDPEDAVTEYLAAIQQSELDSRKDLISETQSSNHRPALTKVKAKAASKGAPKSQGSVAVDEEELPHLQLPRAEHVRHKPKEYLNRTSADIPWLTLAVILVLVSAAALVWVRHSRHTRAAQVSQLTPPAPTLSSSPSPETVALRSTQTASSASALTRSNSVAPNAKLRTTEQSAPDVVSSTSSSVPAVPKKENAELSSSGSVSQASPAALSLVIRANENSWISVTSDGQLVTQETLIAPAHTTVHGNREIVVKVGNAGGVTFSWKGQELPAQGAEGEVRTFTFDTQGLHSPESSPN